MSVSPARPYRLKFTASPVERELIELAADMLGQPVSTYLRNRAVECARNLVAVPLTIENSEHLAAALALSEETVATLPESIRARWEEAKKRQEAVTPCDGKTTSC